jgi:hypothetical protein
MVEDSSNDARTLSTIEVSADRQRVKQSTQKAGFAFLWENARVRTFLLRTVSHGVAWLLSHVWGFYPKLSVRYNFASR